MEQLTWKSIAPDQPKVPHFRLSPIASWSPWWEHPGAANAERQKRGEAIGLEIDLQTGIGIPVQEVTHSNGWFAMQYLLQRGFKMVSSVDEVEGDKAA